jgi:hypothetical protein
MICATTPVLVAQVVAQSGLRHYYRPLRQKVVATGCATTFCRVARPVAQWRRKHPDGSSSPDCSRGGPRMFGRGSRYDPALFHREIFLGDRVNSWA